MQLNTPFELYDFEPAVQDVRRLVLESLSKKPKALPCKLFYDEQGSKLFEEICALEEYYPTRCEMAIFSDNLKQISDLAGSEAVIVELGSGSAVKTKLFLEHLQRPAAYIPVEISKTQLMESVDRLASYFPKLQILPVCADYTKDFQIPQAAKTSGRTIVFFPGSTIGNFEPEDALRFLRKMALLSGDGTVLIGVDLKKNKQIIERAYNDNSGVTAAFNLNLLKRIAREFAVDDFSGGFHHDAVYNEACGRVEMYLVSDKEQTVFLGEDEIRFARGERISTEYSYKYTLSQFRELAENAGLFVEQVFTDSRQWFSLHCLRVERRRRQRLAQTLPSCRTVANVSSQP